MPRQRQSVEQLESAVIQAITDAGGTLTHADLVEQLEASGNVDAVKLILPLSQNGRLKPRLKVQADGGKPVLSYSLSEGA
jgi:hypothetical protein